MREAKRCRPGFLFAFLLSHPRLFLLCFLVFVSLQRGLFAVRRASECIQTVAKAQALGQSLQEHKEALDAAKSQLAQVRFMI